MYSSDRIVIDELRSWSLGMTLIGKLKFLMLIIVYHLALIIPKNNIVVFQLKNILMILMAVLVEHRKTIALILVK